MRPAMRTKAKPEAGDVHPRRCASSGPVRRHGLLSLHSLYGIHFKDRAQPPATRSCYSSDSHMLTWSIYVGCRGRILACGNYRAGGTFDHSVLFSHLTGLAL